MSCAPCTVARQIALNFLLASDRLLNALTLGDPSETVSQRLGRAQRVGNRIAIALCRVLNVINANHCEWSLQPGPSIGAEVWHWSPPVPPSSSN